MKTDSLLGHCVVRAIVASGEKPTKWVGFKVAPRAGRLAGWIAMYALALDDLGPEASHAAIARWMVDSPATFYRWLAYFRELFHEYDDPAPVAYALLDAVEAGRLNPRSALDVRVRLPAVAVAA